MGRQQCQILQRLYGNPMANHFRLEILVNLLMCSSRKYSHSNDIEVIQISGGLGLKKCIKLNWNVQTV